MFPAVDRHSQSFQCYSSVPVAAIATFQSDPAIWPKRIQSPNPTDDEARFKTSNNRLVLP